MNNKIETSQLKNDLPDMKVGDIVKVHQIVKEIPKSKGGKPSKEKEEGKDRIQVFEGVVIARKHGKGINATFTVRRISSDISVERIFPLHSPSIKKIEVSQKGKVRRSKLYYLRERTGKRAKIKKKETKEVKEA